MDRVSAIKIYYYYYCNKNSIELHKTCLPLSVIAFVYIWVMYVENNHHHLQSVFNPFFCNKCVL